MSSPNVPRQIPQNVLSVLMPAIGGIIYTWAHAELGLVFSVATIHHRCGGKTLEPKIPKSLTQIVKYLRKAYRRLPILAPYRAEGLSIVNEMKRRSKLRNMLAHGVIIDFTPRKGTITMMKLDIDVPNVIHMEDKMDVTVPDLVELQIRARELAAASLDLSQRLTQAFVVK